MRLQVTTRVVGEHDLKYLFLHDRHHQQHACLLAYVCTWRSCPFAVESCYRCGDPIARSTCLATKGRIDVSHLPGQDNEPSGRERGESWMRRWCMGELIGGGSFGDPAQIGVRLRQRLLSWSFRLQLHLHLHLDLGSASALFSNEAYLFIDGWMLPRCV